MSWLSAILIHQLEKELIAMEPEIAHFMLGELETIIDHIGTWIDKKGHYAAAVDPKNPDEGDL